MTQTFCLGCFAEPATAAPCSNCGYDPNTRRPLTALPAGILLKEQFLIGRVLGHPGGFGITYLAFDQRLHKRIAIKEYLPRDLATRAADSTRVQPYSTEDGSLYHFGLQQFEQEARTLAQLDHPNIVRVMQFFEAHGSAYLVMDYYSGETLAEYLERQPNGRMAEQAALNLIEPVLDGLRAVHAKGLVHRDIKPANIYLACSSGGVRPILIDFGAARQSVGERSRSLSVILSPGYAPMEQYSRKGDQGTWTDVYAAAAVLYRCLTGETPPEANDRMLGDDLKPPRTFGVSTHLDAVLMAALALHPQQRLRTIAAFRDQLRSTGEAPPPPPTARKSWVVVLAAGLVLVSLAGLGGYTYWDQLQTQRLEQARQDDQRFNDAVKSNRRTAYESYLDPCAPPCAHRAAAVAALAAFAAAEEERKAREAAEQAERERVAREKAAQEERERQAREEAHANWVRGKDYENGRGVAQNDAEAVRLYRLAAEQGHANAQVSLGVMYQNGRGVAQNDVQAVHWYRLAAEQGNAFAQSNLGLMYQNGHGVAQNDAEAVRLYRLAAEQGHANAQVSLGVMYQNGRGVAQNDVQAVHWYRLAAEQGNAFAQSNLGLMYQNGRGVTQNRTEALRLYRLAAAQGNTTAQKNLRSLENNP